MTAPTEDSDEVDLWPSVFLPEWRRLGLPLDRVSISSDAYGSNPKFDAKGNLVA